MEIISIRSFLAHGHDYHLYAYEPIENLPVGVVVRDANEILPHSSVFRYTGYETYAGFANFFRYKLLLERGGWWTDTDVVCLRPFEFASPYVFGSETSSRGIVPASAVIRCPAGSKAMAHAWNVCSSKKPELLKWAETGPKLVACVISLFALDPFLLPPEVFCPLSCHDWRKLLDPGTDRDFFEGSFAIHLWNEMWRRDGCDKDGSYPRDCTYERLKEMYLDLPPSTEDLVDPQAESVAWTELSPDAKRERRDK
jgi:hypothetical protein